MTVDVQERIADTIAAVDGVSEDRERAQRVAAGRAPGLR